MKADLSVLIAAMPISEETEDEENKIDSSVGELVSTAPNIAFFSKPLKNCDLHSELIFGEGFLWC